MGDIRQECNVSGVHGHPWAQIYLFDEPVRVSRFHIIVESRREDIDFPQTIIVAWAKDTIFRTCCRPSDPYTLATCVDRDVFPDATWRNIPPAVSALGGNVLVVKICDWKLTVLLCERKSFCCPPSHIIGRKRSILPPRCAARYIPDLDYFPGLVLFGALEDITNCTTAHDWVSFTEIFGKLFKMSKYGGRKCVIYLLY